MATKKKSAGSSQVKSKGKKSVTAAGRDGVLRSNDIVAEQASASDDFVAAMPYNSSKELEHGHDNAVAPPSGVTVEPDSSSLTASTTAEETETAKTGGGAQLGANATAASLERVRQVAFCTANIIPGILLADGTKAAGIASAFIEAIAAHRHFSRDSDPATK